MGRISEQKVQLRRDSPGVAWGFRLQGGTDSNTPLSVQRVFSGSPSDGQLQRGDILVSVDGRSLRGLSPLDAQDLITSNGLVLNLGLQRGGDGSDSYGSHGPANYAQQQTDNIYSSGGTLNKPYGSLPQGGVPPHSPQQQPWAQSHPQQPAWNTSSGGSGSYQPPSQFNVGPTRQPQNNYSPGFGAAQTNGGYDGYNSGAAQSYTSSANVFGGGQGHDGSYGDGLGKKSEDGGFYGSEGSLGGQQGNNEIDDNYERKSISNIKQMFNKEDETGPRAVGRIKGGRPRAPMYKANEDHSFSAPQYGPTATPKSSLTPSRPGAVQRGAPDNRPSTYIPPPVTAPSAGGYGKKLYGYSQDSTPAPSRYVGGFVGINELTKAVPQPVPVKKPPGQKKDFDPNQSSVLRILQEEEERRKSGQVGPAYEEEDQRQAQQQRRGPPQQQRRGPPQQQQQQPRATGQKWEEQQRQQQRQQPSVGKSSGGPSLQALLERDQAQNPQEDPANNRIQYEPPSQPSQGEYRRPGTSYKPAEHKVKAANVDDYPIPDHLLSGGRGGDRQPSTGYQSSGPSYQQGTGYQSSGAYQQGAGYQPSGGYQDSGPSYQSSAKFSPGSGSGGGFSPRSASGGYGSGGGGYQYGGSADYGRGSSGGGGGYYPATSFGMDGIPASDF